MKEGKKMKKKIVGIFMCMLMVAAVVFPAIGITTNNESINWRTTTYNQIHIISHLATSEEIKEMEQQCGIFNPNKNYNIIYEGHGTGLAPPTKSDYNRMIGSLHIVDTVTSNQPFCSSWDLSTDPCFPRVGDQRGQHSCSAWAATYYTTGFVIAKNLNWTQASTGNTTQLLSPTWTYNKCNEGYDNGSWPSQNMWVIRTVGCCRLCTMPYIYSDPVSWGNESAWRDAPPYRVNNIFQIKSPYNNSTINSIKTLISGGQPITFGLDYLSYSHFGSDDVLGSNAMQPNGLTHANTIVGYDDLRGDAETGETGAFKCVNSWGLTWGPNNNGYYWMTYQALLGTWNICPLNFDDVLYVNSTPTLLATCALDPACDRDALLELGIGSYEKPLATRTPVWIGGNYRYPSFMCLDVTEFYHIWNTSVDDFYLKLGQADHNGIIMSFKVEYYHDNYSPGNPSLVSNESLDVPKNTPCNVNVSFTHPTPNPPSVIGPVKAKIKVTTAYNFTTTDPYGDDVFYFVDWGDDNHSSWIGPYSSDFVISQSHTWTKKGTYTIKAKAKNYFGYESEWGQLSVTMPFSYNIPVISFWQKIFKQFPHAFPILRHLMGY